MLLQRAGVMKVDLPKSMGDTPDEAMRNLVGTIETVLKANTQPKN
jgi:predicted RNase H-like HicB family nuclease